MHIIEVNRMESSSGTLDTIVTVSSSYITAMSAIYLLLMVSISLTIETESSSFITVILPTGLSCGTQLVWGTWIDLSILIFLHSGTSTRNNTGRP